VLCVQSIGSFWPHVRRSVFTRRGDLKRWEVFFRLGGVVSVRTVWCYTGSSVLRSSS
jgi:hypothetical protein